MPLPEANVCCRNIPRITATESFENIILNREVLSIAFIHCSDVYSDDPMYKPRKAAYIHTRSFIT